MIRINLIPPEYAEIQAKKERIIILGAIAIVVFVFMALNYVWKKNQLAALDTNINQAEAKLREYQAIIDQIQNIQRQKSSLLQKRDVIRNLNNSRLVYPVFFEDLLPLIPSDVWIADFQFVRQNGAQLEYRLNSKALSNYALATWLTNMEQSTHFSSVKLDRISYEYPTQDNQTQSVLSFSLSFVYQHRGPMPLSEFN